MLPNCGIVNVMKLHSVFFCKIKFSRRQSNENDSGCLNSDCAKIGVGWLRCIMEQVGNLVHNPVNSDQKEDAVLELF
jgi:hypothetical protein